MSDSEVRTPTKRTSFVRVKDNAGNEFLCPMDALKDSKDATPEELENCVDDAKNPSTLGG